MNCRACGLEIADKAIVCYRYGTSTVEPVVRSAEPGRSTRVRWLAAAAVILALLALWLMRR